MGSSVARALVPKNHLARSYLPQPCRQSVASTRVLPLARGGCAEALSIGTVETPPRQSICKIASLLGAALGSSLPATPPLVPDTRTITASASLAFAPATLTVSAGDTVTFAFQSVSHNVFFDAQTGTPANIEGSNTNTSIARVFTTAGTYHYTCHIHPFMEGTVVVTE